MSRPRVPVLSPDELHAIQIMYKFFEQRIIPFIQERDGWADGAVPVLEITYIAPLSAYDPAGKEDMIPCGEIRVDYVMYDEDFPPKVNPQRPNAKYVNHIYTYLDKGTMPRPTYFLFRHGDDMLIELARDTHHFGDDEWMKGWKQLTRFIY